MSTSFRCKINKKNKIFLKNFIIVLFILKKKFNLKIKTGFWVKKKKTLDILKSPNRHKKFFHQLSYSELIIKHEIFLPEKYQLFLKKNNLNDLLCFFNKVLTNLKVFDSNSISLKKLTINRSLGFMNFLS